VPLHAAATAGDPIGSFEITRFEVEGDTLLGRRAVQAAVTDFTGKTRDFAAVEGAMAALEKAYRKHGFGLVKVILPEQELNAGVVHLKVVETRIGKVRVVGNTTHSETNIRRSLPEVTENAIINTEVLSAQLHVANENPSKKVNLEMQSSDQPGVIDGGARGRIQLLSHRGSATSPAARRPATTISQRRGPVRLLRTASYGMGPDSTGPWCTIGNCV
jgi:hemolysin activation/secretion protein